MNNKKLNGTVIFGFVVLLLVNALISLLIYNQNRQPVTGKQIPVNSGANKLQSIMQKQFETANRSLNINDSLLDSFRNYTGNGTVLVLYIDQYSCSSCVDNAIADLLSFKDSIGIQNILIILSTKNKKDAALMKNKTGNQFKILPVREKDINFEGISENLPVHFYVIDNRLMPFCIYFYAPEFPQLNTQYLNIVYNRFFKKENAEKIPNKSPATTVEPEQAEIELKDMRTGKTSEAVFRLKNTGTLPLLIQTVDASCGCTVPEWEKQPVKAGESAEIKVQITPEEKGYFNKTVTVHCNTGQGQVLLRINGTVN
jgi:hypothetical protein